MDIGWLRPPTVGAPAAVPMEASFDLVRLAKQDCKPSHAQLTAALDQLASWDPVRQSQLLAFVHPVQLKQQAPTQPGRLPSKQEPTILYLGEILCACLAFRNCSAAAMTAVALKLESSVDSSPAVLLHDSSATPLTSLAAGQRELLPLQLDITEPGTHTLACSAVYTDWQGQRKYQVHFFKFRVTSPLAVRTKVRQPPATAATLATSQAAAAAAAAAGQGGGVAAAGHGSAAAAAPEGPSAGELAAAHTPSVVQGLAAAAAIPNSSSSSSNSSGGYPLQGVTRYFLEVTLENAMPQDMSIHGVLIRAAEGVHVLPIAAAVPAATCNPQQQQQQSATPGLAECSPCSVTPDAASARDQDGMQSVTSTSSSSSSRREHGHLPSVGSPSHKKQPSHHHHQQQQQQLSSAAGFAGPTTPHVLGAAGGSRTYLWEVCHQTHPSAPVSSDAGGDAVTQAPSAANSSSSGGGPLRRGLARTSSSGSGNSSSRMPGVPSPVLGRLEILWEGVAGQCGRLQTQPVLAPASAVKPLHLVLSGVFPGGMDAAAASVAVDTSVSGMQAAGGQTTQQQGAGFGGQTTHWQQQQVLQRVRLQERFRMVLDVVLLEPAVLASSSSASKPPAGNSQGAAAAGAAAGGLQANACHQVQLVVLSTDLGAPALPHGGAARHQHMPRLQRRSSTGTGVSGSGCRVFTNGQHLEYSSPGVVVCGQSRVLLAPFGPGQVRQQVVFECMALLPGWQLLPSFVVLAEREGRALDSLHGVHVLVE